MSEDCLFCSIVAGEIPSRTVHESDGAQAFLDVNPLAPGHTLVIPDQHYPRLQEIPANEATEFYAVLHQVVPAVEGAVEADGLTVAINDGEAAGQEIPHVHAHLVPRFEDDTAGPIHALFESRPELDDSEFDDIARRISDTI